MQECPRHYGARCGKAGKKASIRGTDPFAYSHHNTIAWSDMPIPSKHPRWENEGKPKRHTSSFDELASVHEWTINSFRLLVLYRVRFFLNKIATMPLAVGVSPASSLYRNYTTFQCLFTIGASIDVGY